MQGFDIFLCLCLCGFITAVLASRKAPYGQKAYAAYARVARFACAFNMKFKEAEWTERNFQCSTCRSAIGRTMCVVISVVDLSLLDLPIKRKNLFVLNRVIFRQHFN